MSVLTDNIFKIEIAKYLKCLLHVKLVHVSLLNVKFIYTKNVGGFTYYYYY